ncbi:TlpA family protein disulfide reductase [Niabella beijingensis]|uniref:TlpA family protein disulfide reductase n=1 Tax=Niabella beijingensis TaxID=2872700 RepID=UPI001CBE5866|nr:TlpA disulfide reductase family protein [Niabella beijingensis]MBZ4187877.1 TlpA family protein disulfide reductase [Niabella beijingensis]
MKRNYLLLFSLLSTAILFGQQNSVIVHGKIEQLSNNHYIRFGFDGVKIPVNKDGSFEYRDTISDSRYTQIWSGNSSIAYAIWLQPGTYTITCKETEFPDAAGNKLIALLGKIIDGPQDSKLYDGLIERLYEKTDTSFTEVKKQQKITRYMDSVLLRDPHHFLAPSLIAQSYSYVDNAEIQKYIGLLDEKQQRHEAIIAIKDDFKRKEKLTGEKQFYDFSMTTIDNTGFKLSDIKNKKLILIDIGYRTCPGCRAGHPTLTRLYKKYAGKGFEIISVSLDKRKEDWLATIKEDRMEQWINVSDLKGFDSELAKYYNLKWVPFRVLLNKDRKLVKILSSVPTEDDIEAFL